MTASAFASSDDGRVADSKFEGPAAPWLRAAVQEHASVAAFARASVELMGLGAPLSLVERCHRAALDGVAHARMCLGIAERLDQQQYDIGPLPVVVPRAPRALDLAISTFVEGCVGETLASLFANRALSSSQDEGVRSALQCIVENEVRHAQLAWETLSWLVGQMGSAQVRHLVAACVGLRNQDIEVSDLALYGVLDVAQQRAVTAGGWREIIVPSLTALIAGHGYPDVANQLPRIAEVRA